MWLKALEPIVVRKARGVKRSLDKEEQRVHNRGFGTAQALRSKV